MYCIVCNYVSMRVWRSDLCILASSYVLYGLFISSIDQTADVGGF
jgi:hypothetical protein